MERFDGYQGQTVPQRAEVALNATREWRDAARAALAEKPRGTQERCAEAVGCSAGTLSQLLNGAIDHSEFVGPISDFLGIPRPIQMAMDAEEAEANNRFKRADTEKRALILALMRSLVPDD